MVLHGPQNLYFNMDSYLQAGGSFLFLFLSYINSLFL